MDRPIRFYYKCPKCRGWSGSVSPDDERCSVPVKPDGTPMVSSAKAMKNAPRCGGDIGEWGPHVDWWMIPEDIQAEIMRRQAIAVNAE